MLDASRCISYLTIEMRGAIPEELREPMGRHVFGCDICQDVCPWNRKSPRTAATEFQPRTVRTPGETGNGTDSWSLYHPSLLRIASLSEDEFRRIFQGSPLKRTKWKGLIRNACNALGNAKPSRESPGFAEILEVLTRLASAPDEGISESAKWALGRIEGGAAL